MRRMVESWCWNQISPGPLFLDPMGPWFYRAASLGSIRGRTACHMQTRKERQQRADCQGNIFEHQSCVCDLSMNTRHSHELG
eukprot:1479244-Amphidinium_carterae.1